MLTLRTKWGKSRWLLVGGLLLVLLVLGGLPVLRVLRPAAPAAILPGQLLAWDIARAALRSEGVQIASGAYVPGDTLLLYSRIDQTDRTLVRAWALTQLEPFASRLALMTEHETLRWIIDFGVAAAEQEVLSAPLNRAADPTFFRYFSAEPGLFGNPSLGSTITPTVAAVSVVVTRAAPPEATVGVVTKEPPVTATVTATVDLPTIPTQTMAVRKLAFDSNSTAEWQPLAGDWVASNGIYSQRNKTGYDYISMLLLAPQAYYSMEAQLRLIEGEMGGGFIYNAPSQTTRIGAQVIDMDQRGGFLRWGRYDDKGDYVYVGGVKLDPPLNDQQWHTLRLTTQAGTSILALDGRTLGQFANTSTSGYLGLITSKAQVDFDNVNIVIQPPASDLPTVVANRPLSSTRSMSPTVAVTTSTVASFADDFADGNANGWQVLNGTWQVIQHEYQQTSTDGFDLGSISTFQSDAYTMSVRLRRIDGSMGAGLYFNMAERNAKTRSQMINYVQNGKAIQWGHFDEGGNFVFEGSAAVPDGGDGQWHTLAATIGDGKAAFTLDGKLLAKAVSLTYKNGYVGLLTSKSSVAFDDVKLVPSRRSGGGGGGGAVQGSPPPSLSRTPTTVLMS